MIHLAYKHDNHSFFIHCYTKTEIISSMQSHIDEYRDNQLIKSSPSSAAVHSSL